MSNATATKKVIRGNRIVLVETQTSVTNIVAMLNVVEYGLDITEAGEIYGILRIPSTFVKKNYHLAIKEYIRDVLRATILVSAVERNGWAKIHFFTSFSWHQHFSLHCRERTIVNAPQAQQAARNKTNLLMDKLHLMDKQEAIAAAAPIRPTTPAPQLRDLELSFGDDELDGVYGVIRLTPEQSLHFGAVIKLIESYDATILWSCCPALEGTPNAPAVIHFTVPHFDIWEEIFKSCKVDEDDAQTIILYDKLYDSFKVDTEEVAAVADEAIAAAKYEQDIQTMIEQDARLSKLESRLQRKVYNLRKFRAEIDAEMRELGIGC